MPLHNIPFIKRIKNDLMKKTRPSANMVSAADSTPDTVIVSNRNKLQPIVDYLFQQYNSWFMNVKENPNLEEKIVDYINSIRTQINPNAKKFTNEWSFFILIKNAADLMIYRSCLGLIKEEGFNEYKNFVNSNKLFSSALNRDNPFVIEMHMVRLFNLIEDSTNSLANIQELRAELLKVQEKIYNLETEDLGDFHAYLKCFVNFALAISYSTSINSSLIDELAYKKYIAQTFIEARKSRQDFLNNSENLIDFLTCSEGLFAKFPLKSFEQVTNYIMSSNILNKEEIIACINASSINTPASLTSSSELVIKKMKSSN